MGGSPKAAAPETPGDDTQPKARKRTERHKRYDLFDDGQGDYRIMAIASSKFAKDHDIPARSYLAVPDCPGFRSARDALRWIRDSGSALQGLQVIVIRGHHIVSVEVEQTPRITIKEKPRSLREPAAVA